MDSNSKEYKALQQKWYDKLKAKGFKDIERKDGNLETWAAAPFRYYEDPNSRSAKEEYYRLAGQFLYEHKFTSAHEKLAWQYHADGVSVVNIAKALNKKGIKTSKSTIHGIVKKLAKLMIKRAQDG